MKSIFYLVLMLSISILSYTMDKSEKKSDTSFKKILWIGCKASHTKYEDKGFILEMTAVVTNEHLDPIDESETYIIGRHEWNLNRIESSLKEEYIRSGLFEKSKTSKLECYHAEASLIEFIDQHFPGTKPNTYIYPPAQGHIMTDEMSDLSKRINHQIFGFDLKKLIKVWDPSGTYQHTEQVSAKANAFEALKELQHYKQRYFDSVKDAK